MNHPLHNLPNSNETSTAGRSSVLVPCALIAGSHRFQFNAQFFAIEDGSPRWDMRVRNALGRKAGTGAVDTPLSGRPGANVSEIPHNGSDM